MHFDFDFDRVLPVPDFDLFSDFDVFLVLDLEFVFLLPPVLVLVPVLSGFKVGHGHTV